MEIIMQLAKPDPLASLWISGRAWYAAFWLIPVVALLIGANFESLRLAFIVYGWAPWFVHSSVVSDCCRAVGVANREGYTKGS